MTKDDKRAAQRNNAKAAGKPLEGAFVEDGGIIISISDAQVTLPEADYHALKAENEKLKNIINRAHAALYERHDWYDEGDAATEAEAILEEAR